MMKRLSNFLIPLLFLAANFAHADTTQAPGGIGILAFKYIDAEVPNSFGKTGVDKDFSVKETLGASVIRGISADVASAYDQLQKLNPAIADNINLGYIDLEPKIHVTATAYGLAFGITDRVMIAVGVPVMHADVQVNGGYVNSGSVAAAAAQLQAITDPATKDYAHTLGQVLAQLPTIKGEYLQGVIVNTYHYKPLGNWSATGIGDAQAYTQIKLIEGDFYRQAVKLGVDLPTGHPDDPDNLVDVPFGQGYMDTYLESLHDFSILEHDLLTLGILGRYQYSLATTQNFRLAPSTSFPLTDQEESIHYKPGNTYIIGAGLSTKIFRSLGFSASYSIKEKLADKINGNHSGYDYGILENGTDSRANTVDAEISFSTADLFLHHKFPIPCKIGLEASRVVSGINTQRVNQTVLNAQMYF